MYSFLFYKYIYTIYIENFITYSMSITLQNSNIVINDGTSNFILEHMKTTGTRKNNIETNTPTISPTTLDVTINKVSDSEHDKYIMFTYDLDKTYYKIAADETNLIAWYKLDDGWFDSSGNDKHLTQYSPSYNGFYDDTAFFTGSTYYEAANDGYFSPEVFSISVWAKISTGTSHQTIASCRIYPNSGWSIYLTNDNLEIWLHNGSYTVHGNYPKFSGINNGQPIYWKHLVVAVNNPNNTIKIWVDGILIDSHSGSSIGYTVDKSNPFRIGAGEAGGAGYKLTNKSLLRDFRMYNTELTAADVAILYNNNNSDPPVIYEKDDRNLVIWNKFIGNLDDSSGNGNNLIATGTVTYDTQNYIFNQSSVYLSGDTYFTAPTTLDMYKVWLNGGITLSAWFKADPSSDTWAGIYEIYLDANNRLGVAKNGSNADLWIGKLTGGSTWNVNAVVSNSTFFNNIWHHLVFIIDGSGNWEVYLDNVKVNNYAATGQPPLSTFRNLYVGNTLGGANRQFKGNIDDFRLYDTALTGDDVEKLYYRSCQNYYRDSTKYTLTFPEDTECDVLVVGGGGGGGMDMGGGGGAGGYVYTQNYSATANTPITIYVGDGGAGAPGCATFGQNTAHQYNINAKIGYNSSFGDIIAFGGGYGGSSASGDALGGYAADGGSGGGGGGYGVTGREGMGISSQGNNGGGGSGSYYSGGGGGAGEVGGKGTSAGAAKGGDGLYNDIMGVGYYWAGGGGGGGYSTTGGNGGLGGGGGGAVNTTYGGAGYNDGEPGGGGGTNSHANTPGGNAGRHTGGGGGGGAHFQGNNKGGEGGSGVVIVKYTSKYQSYDYDPQWKHDDVTPTVKFLGNVGIGTKSSADYTLNIKGNINISGNVYSKDGERNFSKNTYNASNGIGPVIVDKSVILAEEATGHNGWHYVKYSSSAATKWFPSYDNREIIPPITHKFIFDEYGSFDKPFPEEWDEIIFIRDDSNMYRKGSEYGVQYSYMTREQVRNIVTRDLNWTSTPIKKTQNGYNQNIYIFNNFSNTTYNNQPPFIMCQNRNSSVASDLVYHEEYQTINNSIPTNATSNWFARASVTQYTNIYVLVRNSKDYNVRIPSIIPTPYYTDRTKYLQYNAEQATGVKGWRLVRFLPHTSSTWYTGNYFTTTNMEVNASLGTAYDYTNEFMVPFGTYDEIWFGTYDMRYWVHTYKTSVLGNYSDAPRNVISSSENPNPHTIEWYNRTGATTYDPVITHINYGDTGFLRLYVEDTYTAINAIPQNGGMCVFVRNSLNPVSEYSYDTEYKILKFEHSKGNENQTEYIIDFPVETECDILVVGGGGGGGTRFGGGGGAGLLIYKENQKFNGTVVVKVGKGGLGAQNGNGSKGNIGMDSVLISNVETLIAKGGGGGGHESVNGDDGGSGGGGSYPTTDFGGKGSGDKLAITSIPAIITSLGSNVVLWHDAKNIDGSYNSTINNGDDVTTWNNLSSSSFTTTASSSYAPNYNGSGLYFSGTDTIESSINLNNYTTMNLFIVWKPIVNYTSLRWLWSQDNGGYDRTLILYASSGTQHYVGVGDGGTAYSSFSFATNTTYIVNCEYNANGLTGGFYVNNSLDTSFTSLSPNGRTTMNFGNVSNNGSGINGDIYEIIIIDKLLTSTERTDLYNYLNDKWSNPNNDLYEFGNDGADGYFTGSQGTRVTGGGGGAGGPGKGTMLESPNGGIGRQYNISGISTYYAGGGGGANSDHDSWGYDAMGIGGLGGGGNGGQSSPAIVAEDGGHGTGGGGGGGYLGSTGGDGGSGIVIIKYKEFTTPNKMVQWTYKSENTDVYTMNDVAIKKEYATSTLDVNGDITATDKNFKIYHPLGYNKWLYHSSIEAPRYDNIYRGKKTIINGVATVDIDKECNETGGMSQGTFVALNRNPQLYLRNNKTFDKVKGEIIDGKIKIYSENTKDKIEIDWMVMAERQDNNIKQSLLTNNDGNLICEKNRILS